MEEEIEYWKDIEGYDGDYQISSFGRVKSFKQNKINGKILKLNKDFRGYTRLNLCKNNIITKTSVHRLVCFAFLDNPENKPDVNHKDNTPTNNRLDNLEWATKSDNMQHMLKQGRGNRPKGEKHFLSKFTKKEVDEIRLNKDNLSQIKLGEIYNMSKTNISNIINNKRWKF